MTVRVGVEDIQRIATEYASLLSRGLVEENNPTANEAFEAVGRWIEKEGIERDALNYVSEQCEAAFAYGLHDSLSGEEEFFVENPMEAVPLNLRAMAFMAFAIGWEAHKEYGRKR